MDSPLEKLKREVSGWPHVTVHPQRFAAKEFRFGRAEVGHVHQGGIVDIPFPRPIRDALLAEGHAEEHHWVPNSGWITFRVRSEQDLGQGRWLLRLSYVRYALKGEADPQGFFERERKQLHLRPHLASLLAQFIPMAAVAQPEPRRT